MGKFIIGLMATSACVYAGVALAADGVHLKKEIAVPSEGGAFDYVAYNAGKLFIGHRPEGLQVIDLANGFKMTPVADSKGANGAALAPDLDLGVSANGDGTLTLFKLSDASVVKKITVAKELDSAHYDPVTKRIAVFGAPGKDDKGSTVMVYQLPGGEKLGEVASESGKLEISTADGQGALFVNMQDLNAVAKFDMKAMQFTDKWPVPCNQPTSIDIDTANKRLFIGCRGAFVEPMFVVVNAETGAIVTKMPTSPGNDGLAYDAARKRVYITDGIGAHLLVVEQADANTYKLVEVVGTRPMAKTIALDPASGDVFSITAEPIYDASKKNLAYIAPYYPNAYTKDTFKILQYGR